MTEAPRRGHLGLYALAFALMLCAAVVLVVASLGSLSSIRLLRVSAGLSAVAVVVALASVLVPRR